MHNLSDWVTHLNWVDFVFLVVIIYSALTGAWLGFLAECLSVAGIASATIVAGLTYNPVGSLLGHLGVPVNARDWAGFVAVFLLISVVFRILSVVARKVSRMMIAGWSNVVAGGLLGLIAGGAICLCAIVVVIYFHVGDLTAPLQHSKIATSSSSWLQEYTALLPEKMHGIVVSTAP